MQDIHEKIGTIIKNLYDVQNDKLLLWSVIYEKKCQELLENKLSQFKEYLDGQSKFYKINKEKYRDKFDELVSAYKNKMTRIFMQYTKYYIYVQDETVVAKSNQNIAIANLVSSNRNKIRAVSLNNDILIQKADRKIFATAQKKLNYDIVLDECTKRLEMCMLNTFDAINEIFSISNNQISNYNSGMFNKIKHFLGITFYGDKKFNKYVLDNLNVMFEKLEEKTISKILEIKLATIAFHSQINKVRNDINLAFNETLNKM